MASAASDAQGSDPSPPAFDTAIASALPCTPAMGAWMIGRSTSRMSSRRLMRRGLARRKSDDLSARTQLVRRLDRRHDMNALKSLNRLVGTWTTEATHPMFPGVTVRGTAVIE